MNNGIEWLWELDGWIVVAGVLCAVASSLVGSFLVLRRMSMLGDAISHAVLPGLAAAFLISGSRQSLPMFVGAAIVGVLTAVLTEWIRSFGKVEEDASMGVVFTTLFALGLVMIVQAADAVDLDPGCVLYGAIEFTPLDTVFVNGWFIPRVVVTLAAVTVSNLLFIMLFFKELKLTSFDPALANTMGLRSSWVHYLLMTMVAITAVAAFESVGNILVVAMMVVPPSGALLLTNRLPWVLVIGVGLAALSAVLGHLSAMLVPHWLGYSSTSTGGMMALMAGMLFGLILLFSPKQGLVNVFVRQQRLALGILGEDVLAYLYRQDERGVTEPQTVAKLTKSLLASRGSLHSVLWFHRIVGNLRYEAGGFRLTSGGRAAAVALVRSHRLWEQYLVDQAGLRADQIHGMAERLEHFTDRTVRDELEKETEFPAADPHGSPIPNEVVPSSNAASHEKRE